MKSILFALFLVLSVSSFSKGQLLFLCQSYKEGEGLISDKSIIIWNDAIYSSSNTQFVFSIDHCHKTFGFAIMENNEVKENKLYQPYNDIEENGTTIQYSGISQAGEIIYNGMLIYEAKIKTEVNKTLGYVLYTITLTGLNPSGKSKYYELVSTKMLNTDCYK